MPPLHGSTRLETERLSLRPLTIEDTQDVFDIRRLPAVYEMHGGKTPGDIAYIERWIGKLIEEGRLCMAIHKKDRAINETSTKPSGSNAQIIHSKQPASLIGLIGVGCWGLFFYFHPDNWGVGYCTEALHKFLEVYFKLEHNTKVLNSFVRARNVRARRVLENCGLAKVLRLERPSMRYRDFTDGGNAESSDSQDMKNYHDDSDSDSDPDEDAESYLIPPEKEKVTSQRRLTKREEKEMRESCILLVKLIKQTEREEAKNSLVRYQVHREDK